MCKVLKSATVRTPQDVVHALIAMMNYAPDPSAVNLDCGFNRLNLVEVTRTDGSVVLNIEAGE